MKPRTALWDAINGYVVTCGGEPGQHVYGNSSRQRMVAQVERADLLRRLAPILLAANRRGGISGQAFTEYTCLMCELPRMHPNTAVPVLCQACEGELLALKEKRP